MLIAAEAATLLLFPSLMAYAASSDLFTMRIPNVLSLIAIAGFGVLAVWTGMAWSVLLWHAVAFVLVLGICFFMFAMGWIGGGDAKLAAVTALWIGFDLLLPYFAISSFLGGLLTLGILAMRSSDTIAIMAPNWDWLNRLRNKKNGVPYGIALAAAGLMLYPQTYAWKAWIGV
jgi:prepilin peptidase CpaA